MGSDHRPLLITVRRSTQCHDSHRRNVGFRYLTRGKSAVSRARKVVQEAYLQKRQERKSGGGYTPPWMTDDVRKAWEEKMSASKEFSKAKRENKGQVQIQARREAFNSAATKYREVASEAKQAAWNRFCEESDPTDLSVTSRFWKLAKAMSKTANGGDSSPQQITGPDGEKLTTDIEKGEAFL